MPIKGVFSGEFALRLRASLVGPLRAILVLVLSFFYFLVVANSGSQHYLRSLSMQLRTGYGIVLPFVFLVLYLTFRLNGLPSALLSLFATLTVFGLALSGVWATGQTESGLLNGVIPMFDSATYYGDALRLLAGHAFTEGSTRRPVFSAFFAFLLWVSNRNLLYALTLLTFLVAIACYLLAREIRGTHGALLSAFVLVFVFIYYRYHSGVVRTENLGVLFGALGTALAWRGLSKGRAATVLAGIALTGLGMVARAGAFFILPLLVLWGAFLFKEQKQKVSLKFMAAGAFVVALGFLLNQMMVKSFGAQDVAPFGNFSYSFYGLAAGGKSWAVVQQLYPGVTDREIYRLALGLILEKPGLFLAGVLHNYAWFFSNSNYGVFSYMGGEGNLASGISYWVLVALSLLGLWNGFQQRRDPHVAFVLVSTAGLLLSVPFLPPTDAFRLRVYATSIVFLALMPALGLQWILTKLKGGPLNPRPMKPDRGKLDYLAGFSLFAVVIVVAGPFLAWKTAPLPSLGQSACPEGLVSLVVRYEPGSALYFVPQTTPLLDRAPTFHIGLFRRNLHAFPNLDFMDWALENVTYRNALFSTLDYRSFRNALVVAEGASLPAPPALLELCGRWEDQPEVARFDIFYVNSVFSMDQSIGQERGLRKNP